MSHLFNPERLSEYANDIKTGYTDRFIYKEKHLYSKLVEEKLILLQAQHSSQIEGDRGSEEDRSMSISDYQRVNPHQ